VAQVEGMSDGSNRSVTMKVDDSEEDEALRGKEVRVEIMVDRVNKREVPAIDDTLAQTVGAYENLGQLREKITSQLMDYKTQLARNEYQDQVVGAFESLSEITLPPKYMDDRVDEALEDFKERVKRDDKLDFPDWLKLNGMTEEQARETLTESVTKQARVNLVLGGMRNADDTKLDAGELDAALERQRELATIRNAAYRESLGNRLLTDKVLKRMMDIAQGKVVETATDEAATPAGL
jgi:trigger factor